jgi:hypothetical protein
MEESQKSDHDQDRLDHDVASDVLPDGTHSLA